MKKIISISGLGKTGSSSLINYFYNHELIYSIESEFFLFRIVDGFFDLYRALFFHRKSGLDESHYSVLKFKKIMRTLYHTRYSRNKEIHFSYFTLKFPIRFNVLGDNFLYNIDNFIREITLSIQKRHTPNTYLFISLIKYNVYKKIERIAGVMYKLRLMPFRFKFRDEIAAYTTDSKLFVKLMIKTIFDNFAVSNRLGKMNILILNQAFTSFDGDILRAHNDDFGLILFIRDPRDIYVESIDLSYNNNVEWMFGSNKHKDQRLEEFIQFQTIQLNALNSLRKMKNVLIIDFADFCLNHEYIMRKVNSFIGLQINNFNHNSRFSLRSSAKNVGLYKKYPYKQELEKIKDSLGGLYSFE